MNGMLPGGVDPREFERMRPFLEKLEMIQAYNFPDEQMRREHFMRNFIDRLQRRHGMFSETRDINQSAGRHPMFSLPPPGFYAPILQEQEGTEFVPPEQRSNPFFFPRDVIRQQERYNPRNQPVMPRQKRS